MPLMYFFKLLSPDLGGGDPVISRGKDLCRHRRLGETIRSSLFSPLRSLLTQNREHIPPSQGHLGRGDEGGGGGGRKHLENRTRLLPWNSSLLLLSPSPFSLPPSLHLRSCASR